MRLDPDRRAEPFATASRALLLGQGRPLKEIADVLRHRSLDTSAIYAKVDDVRLVAVALPGAGQAERSRYCPCCPWFRPIWMQRRRLGFALAIPGGAVAELRPIRRSGRAPRPAHCPAHRRTGHKAKQGAPVRPSGRGAWRSSARSPGIARRSNPAPRSPPPTSSATSGDGPRPTSTPSRRSRTCWPRRAVYRRRGRCARSPMRRSSAWSLPPACGSRRRCACDAATSMSAAAH